MTLTAYSQRSHARTGPAAAGPSGAGVAGAAAGVSASLVWGSAFLVPVLLGGWNPVIVTLGRYLVYGLLSAILFTLGGGGPRRVLREHWRTALAFALAGNAVYYLLLVIGVRAAGAPLTDMVIGAIPVVVAVTGNVLAPAGDRVSWRRLALPLTLVTAGLALVSALEIVGVHAYLAVPPAEKVAGLLAACAAVAMWTWYALANARFLARALPDPLERSPQQQLSCRPGHRPEHAVKSGTGLIPLPAEARRGPGDPEAGQGAGDLGLQHAEVVTRGPASRPGLAQ